MGRELRRKQAKREGKNVREVQKKRTEKPITPKTLVIIMCLLLVFFIVLYILTGLFVTKELKWFGKNNEETITEIENKILAVDSLKQSEDEYFVYYYDPKEEDTEIANSIYGTIEKIYRVNLNDAFNSNYIGEPSGVVDNIENLKVSNPTLIKVSFGKIVEFYSNTDDIINALM